MQVKRYLGHVVIIIVGHSMITKIKIIVAVIHIDYRHIHNLVVPVQTEAVVIEDILVVVVIIFMICKFIYLIMNWFEDIERIREEFPCASCSNCSQQDDCKNKKHWNICGSYSYDR